jgi:putative Mg2+ transporter-C (MgtC) family protein
MHYAAAVAAAVLVANIGLRPLAYRLHPVQQDGSEQEIDYSFELVCRGEDEAPMRALLLQTLSQSRLTLIGLRSEDIEGTSKLRVSAQIRGLGRQNEALEQMVARLSLEAGVTSVSWAVTAQAIE